MAFDMGIQPSGGGRSRPDGRYVLRHYGPMNLAHYFNRRAHGPVTFDWDEFHKLQKVESVDRFNAGDHKLPDECAHTMISAYKEDTGKLKVVGLYSYGFVLTEYSAHSVLAKRFPDIAEDVLKDVIRPGQFVFTPEMEISPLYSFTIAVLSLRPKQRTTVWENPTFDCGAHPGLSHS